MITLYREALYLTWKTMWLNAYFGNNDGLLRENDRIYYIKSIDSDIGSYERSSNREQIE